MLAIATWFQPANAWVQPATAQKVSTEKTAGLTLPTLGALVGLFVLFASASGTWASPPWRSPPRPSWWPEYG